MIWITVKFTFKVMAAEVELTDNEIDELVAAGES